MWKYAVKSFSLIPAVINFHCSRNLNTISTHDKLPILKYSAAIFLQLRLSSILSFIVWTRKTSMASTPKH